MKKTPKIERLEYIIDILKDLVKIRDQEDKILARVWNELMRIKKNEM